MPSGRNVGAMDGAVVAYMDVFTAVRPEGM